jgi:hypothetical protein
MYFDIKQSIEEDLKKMQALLTHANGTGTIFAIDSNARSTTWHNILIKEAKSWKIPYRKPPPHCK